MSVNGKAFMAAFDAYIETVETSYNETFMATALDMFSSIVKLTPVDKGRLRANWQVDINSMPSGEVSGTDKTGNKAISKANSKIDQFKKGSIYFANNLPYADVAEYGLWGTGESSTGKTNKQGYSIQAPSGMVRVTLTSFEQALKKAAKDNKA